MGISSEELAIKQSPEDVAVLIALNRGKEKYFVSWSEKDGYVGRCSLFPELGWVDLTAEKAMLGIENLVIQERIKQQEAARAKDGLAAGYIGKTISSVEIRKTGRDKCRSHYGGPGASTLRIGFSDGTELNLADDKQCCEERYMTTDDDLSSHFGSKLLKIEIADGGQGGDYEQHDIQFLRVHTSHDILTISNHNEHNGYYGGFYISPI